MKQHAIKEEYSTSGNISQSSRKRASEFVTQAKKIARSMATNYNIKKKAFEAASTSYHQNGSLDISRIHSYRTSDDIFKRKVTLKEGQSHGLVCALDFSVSMQSLLPPVAMQFLITSLFSKYIGIEFRFFTFTSDYVKRTPSNAAPPNMFSLKRETEYARFVDIGNQTMSESQLIESFYHILSFSELFRAGFDDNTFSKKYSAYIKRTFKDMNSTPLLAAIYQTYLIAKDMQNRGVQNVNILAINDGDNNCYFLNNAGEDPDAHAYSVEDPYSRRIYSVDPSNCGPTGILSGINKMIRDNGIKIYNMFLSKNLSTDIDNITLSYLRNTDIPDRELSKDRIDIMFSELDKTGKTEVKNLCFYDSVIFVDTKIFPQLRISTESNTSVTDSNYLAERKAGIKKLASLGTFLSDAMVTDFKLSNINK
jgi:hypothetical protein